MAGKVLTFTGGMEMFRAEFLIEDKDVVRLLHMIAGMRVFDVSVRPVANAKRVNGKVEEAVPGGKVADRVAAALREKGTTRLDRKMIFETTRQLGNVPNSNLLEALVKAKVIRKRGRGLYILIS
jgi:hypothetical protein